MGSLERVGTSEASSNRPFIEGSEMNAIHKPSAGAKLHTNIYLWGGAILWAVVALGGIGWLPVGLMVPLLCALIVVVLAADFPDFVAVITGDKEKQRQERQSWDAATQPLRTGFLKARQFWTKDLKNPLSEVGAIGLDLNRACVGRVHATGRQSGVRRSGTGGHKKPASSGLDDDDGGEPPAPQPLPLVWTVYDLAEVLSVSPKTLQNQNPADLPPAVRIPGCKGPRYRLRDVLAWLDGFPADHQRPAKRGQPLKAKGRPRIASAAQIAAIRGKGV